MDFSSRQGGEYSKNPFGRKNGKLITVFDLNPNTERGERCDCICPSCGGPFEARMGDVRNWHFAHTGEGCDETKAYINSNYELLRDSLLSEKKINLPKLICRFTTQDYVPGWHNCEVIICNSESYNTDVVKEETQLLVENAELETDSTGTHKAVIVNDKLAIVIELDKKYCVSSVISQYKDYDTVVIDFRGLNYSNGIVNLYSYISSDISDKRWKCSSIAEDWKKTQLENWKKNYAEQQRKAAEEAERREQERAEWERKREIQRQGDEEKHRIAIERAQENARILEEQIRIEKAAKLEAKKKESEQASENYLANHPKAAYLYSLLGSSSRISGKFLSHQSNGYDKTYNENQTIRNVKIEADKMCITINNGDLTIFVLEENQRKKNYLRSGRSYTNIDLSGVPCERIKEYLFSNGIIIE